MVAITGRILIVSARDEVSSELEPILRRCAHLPVTVRNGAEAVRMLGDGVAPDLLITDRASTRGPSGVECVERFRHVNRVGRHLSVVEEGTPADGEALEGATLLLRPFDAAEVATRIREALSWANGDLRALRGEIFGEVDRLERGMRDLQRQTVHALALTIAVRDPYMHGHAARVAGIARAVGGELGVTGGEMERLESAALLHEIGKGSVPLELLHKTEPLTPAELERIRGHAKAGAAILRAVAPLRSTANLVEHQGTDHSELEARLSKGSGDLLLAGILRVCDVWDAMASERSYRGPEPRAYREEVLRSGAGRRFHALAVEALLRVTPPDPRPASRTA